MPRELSAGSSRQMSASRFIARSFGVTNGSAVPRRDQAAVRWLGSTRPGHSTGLAAMPTTTRINEQLDAASSASSPPRDAPPATTARPTRAAAIAS
jgi:hypothetical protein